MEEMAAKLDTSKREQQDSVAVDIDGEIDKLNEKNVALKSEIAKWKSSLVSAKSEHKEFEDKSEESAKAEAMTQPEDCDSESSSFMPRESVEVRWMDDKNRQIDALLDTLEKRITSE